MSFDATMKFSTAMNRTEIEAMIGECRTFAAAADLPPVAKILTNVNGLPAAELKSRITPVCSSLAAKTNTRC